jgi:hypothetical protein
MIEVKDCFGFVEVKTLPRNGDVPQIVRKRVWNSPEASALFDSARLTTLVMTPAGRCSAIRSRPGNALLSVKLLRVTNEDSGNLNRLSKGYSHRDLHTPGCCASLCNATRMTRPEPQS